MTAYAELAAATNFSFLEGASHPHEMVARSLELSHTGLGIADRNTVAGVVRAWDALRQARAKLAEAGEGAIDFRLVTGARLVFADATPDIIAYPVDRRGWGRLTRLLTAGNLRAKKGECRLHLADLLDHAEGLLLIVLPGAVDCLPALNEAAAGVWCGATMLRQGSDRRDLALRQAQAAAARVPLIAVNDALYASPEQRPLHDLLTCIATKTTIHAAGRRLAANAERHLKDAAEMARLFADAPQAIAETQHLLARVGFDLGQLAYEYPHEPVPPGYTPQAWLETLTRQRAAEKWPDGLPADAEALLAKELGLIGKANYAAYFLTVHDIVAFANSRGILCQGRGSAANSLVCFLLGITAVDPLRFKLLFARFISEERKEPPDIDVDFEHERREEVMQYIYRRYGRERAGIAATVIHYRPAERGRRDRQGARPDPRRHRPAGQHRLGQLRRQARP